MFPKALKIAIEERDQTCNVEGCDRTDHLERHHLEGGFAEHHLTTYELLGNACPHHHDLITYRAYDVIVTPTAPGHSDHPTSNEIPTRRDTPRGYRRVIGLVHGNRGLGMFGAARKVGAEQNQQHATAPNPSKISSWKTTPSTIDTTGANVRDDLPTRRSDASHERGCGDERDTGAQHAERHDGRERAHRNHDPGDPLQTCTGA